MDDMGVATRAAWLPELDPLSGLLPLMPPRETPILDEDLSILEVPLDDNMVIRILRS
jgi:hypothetical protein